MPQFLSDPISRRRFLRHSAGVATGLLLTACADPLFVGPNNAWVTPTPSPVPTPIPLPTATPLPDAPLAVKLGQMVMVGFRGKGVADDSPIVQTIRDRHLGGVVLIDNADSRDQLLALTTALQTAAPDLPLLIAIDQEGGRVARLGEINGFDASISAQILGKQDDIEATRSQADGMAQSLAEMGINLNLAPVVDLNLNPASPIIGGVGRSFSADPEVVTRHARAFVEAHHAQGVGCVLKHFPGHGSGAGDTHWGQVDITDTWQEDELAPYGALADEGLADVVMVGHLFHRDLDPDHPASLSRPIIDDLLRGELGFGGVVMTDDLQMRAITDNYTFEESVALAVEAGADILLFSQYRLGGENLVEKAVDHLSALVAAGEIDVARINASYGRILALKAGLAKASDDV